MEKSICAIGVTISVIGLAIEFVAFAGMAFYPVRKALPVKSPIQLQSSGCAVFFLGVLVTLAGRWLV